MPLKQYKKVYKTHTRGHAKHYQRVYWPYLPLLGLAIVSCALSFAAYLQGPRQSVLGAATSIESRQLLSATNAERTQQRVGALALNSSLSAAAQAKAQDMADHDYWSHVTPAGQQPWSFVEGTGYSYGKLGENLAYGFNNSGSVVSGWLNSSTHRANLLDPGFSEIGFGVASSPNYQNQGPQTVVVALYGKPAASAATLGDISNQPPAKISRVQALTGGRAPWSAFAIGVICGAVLIYLTLKHSLSLKKVLLSSERFVLSHPIIDTVLLLSVGVGFSAVQTIGLVH